MKLCSVLSMLALSVAATKKHRTQIAYVGSGGCDGAMTNCKDDADREHVIQAMEVNRHGRMRMLPDFAIPTDGMPVWLIPHGTPAGAQCLFVTLADIDMVASYAVDPLQGTHKLVGKYKSGGVAPVHGSVMRDLLLIANYHGPDDAQTSDGASAATMKIMDDCALKLVDSVAHSGSSVIPWRQGGAHVHSFNAGYNNQAYACDLGQDKIFTYQVSEEGKLQELSRVNVTPGLGPRHAVQCKEYLYVVNEMGQAVTAFKKHSDGSLTLNQTIDLVREDRMNNLSKAAEIVGKVGDEHHYGYLYATNRGERNTVSVLAIGYHGTIHELMQADAPSYPRGMTLAHDGRVLLVAGQENTEIVSYRVGRLGCLQQTKYKINASQGLPPHPATFAIFEPATAEITV